MQEAKLREKVKKLEARYDDFQKNMTKLLALQGETVAAVVSILGEEKVKTEIQRLRDERREKALAEQRKLEEQAEKGVEVLKAQGVLVPADSIGPGTFVIAKSTKAGMPTKRVQFEFNALPDPTSRARYLGKKAGDEVTGKNESGEDITVAIEAVYRIVAEAVKPHAEKFDAAIDAKLAEATKA